MNAVLVAAGTGVRMGGSTPKQFRRLAGKPVIVRSVVQLQSASELRRIIIVVRRDEMARARRLFARGAQKIPLFFVSGGKERQDSVWSGIQMIDDRCDLILIHDAVRPLASPRLIQRCLTAAWKFGAAVPGIPLANTVKQVSRQGMVRQTIPRDSLWEIQTPQVFHTALLISAYEKARREGFYGTDDAALVERAGTPVKVVEGERWNIKITLPSDLLLAEALFPKLAQLC